MNQVLVFDIWGRYAHYKKIYATTSAVSYCIPTKTSIYGYLGAILGLSKEQNTYLKYFAPGKCQIALQVLRPIVMQRINTNLRAGLGRMKATDNRKPTTVEYIYQPKYRLYVSHDDDSIFRQLEQHLLAHTSVYTPTLGLAYLLSNFEYIGKHPYSTHSTNTVSIESIIPRQAFLAFDFTHSFDQQNEIIEQSQYALEMDAGRNVIKRDDILLDRKGQAIYAEVQAYQSVQMVDKLVNIILF